MALPFGVKRRFGQFELTRPSDSLLSRRMVAILHREMRIASRRKWTFRSRVITSAVAFFCGTMLMLVAAAERNVTGETLFTALVFFSFWFCLIQGVRRASGSIADE